VGGTATVLGCLFTNNASHVNFGGGDGGAIYAGGSGMTIIDSTFTGNSDNTGEYSYYGGAIDASSPTTIITSTITGNSGSNGGGGIYNNQTTVNLVNDIVWNNTGSQGPNFASTNGSYTISYSLLGNASGANNVTYGPGDILNVPTSPSILDSLANNGGPTQTMAPVPNSLPVGAAGNVAQLSSGISSSTTSFSTSSGSVFGAGVLPTLAAGSYYTIEIGNEQMAVIGASGSTLTVVRGINGTSAATHSSGASVYLVSDQRSFVVPPNNSPVVDMGAYQTTGLAPLPTVTSINPSSGPTAGGTTVVIAGGNFTDATAVRFGATNATTFTVNSAAQITATAPAGTGVVDVTVVTASGTSSTSSPRPR
jgi:hypothetical protein